MKLHKQIHLQFKAQLSMLNTIALAFCLCFTLFSCAPNKALEKPFVESKLSIGSAAPDFTLKSNSKENIRLNELRGNLILINFWAAWSGTSTRLLPQFEALYQKHKGQNFTVLSINIDPSTAQNVIQKQNPEHHILFDQEKEVYSLYHVMTVPSIFLVDQSGRIVLSLEGFDPRYHDIIENKIETLLRSE